MGLLGGLISALLALGCAQAGAAAAPKRLVLSSPRVSPRPSLAAAPASSPIVALQAPLLAPALFQAPAPIFAATQLSEVSRTAESLFLEQKSGFDKRFNSAFTKRLRSGWDVDFDGDQAARYREAVEKARRHDWATVTGVHAESWALAGSAGLALEPAVFESHGRRYEGQTLSPEKGLSRLNTLAAHWKEKLGIAMSYFPGFTGDSAAFRDRERRLFLPHFGRVDYYAALLHEARHAYYSRSLRQGKSRLFHFEMLAWPGWTLHPDVDAGSYSERYLSFEELSTFPKTLRHMLSAAEQADSQASRGLLLEMLVNRAKQYSAILEVAAYTIEQAQLRSKAAVLEADVASEKEIRARGLEDIPGGRYLKLKLHRGTGLLPIETQDQRRFLGRFFGTEIDPLAWKTVALKLNLLGALINESRPLARAFEQALASDDLAGAKKTANALNKLLVQADADWLKRYAALKTSR